MRKSVVGVGMIVFLVIALPGSAFARGHKDGKNHMEANCQVVDCLETGQHWHEKGTGFIADAGKGCYNQTKSTGNCH